MCTIALAARGELAVVGDQHERRVRRLRIQLEQQLPDPRAGRPYRDCRSARRRTAPPGCVTKARASRDALLLAAGELARVVAGALFQADAAQRLERRARASARPASSSGSITFSSAVSAGIRWKDWNTKPTRCARSRARPSSSRLREIRALEQHAPRGRQVEPGEQRQQRRFAGARGPDDRDRLTALRCRARRHRQWSAALRDC